MMKQTDRGVLEGIDLAYETRGAGEPVVLIHAGVCADFFKPLLQEQALTDRYRLLGYHRAGYGHSSRLAGPVSIAQQAAHCRSLMRHLGIERAHVVGHSSSAMMALQLALDAPDAVQTLALLDSARPAPESELQMEFVRSVVQPALQRYRTGDKAGAIDTFMQGVCGPDYRTALEQAVPGAFEQAVADAETFFGQELPAVQQWSFGPEEASRIAQPVLAVGGEKSRPIFRERRELLLAWLPNVEPFILPEVTHLLHVQNPHGMATGLVTFFARHPL
jgi:pimeloyl-ACP methyl ester carboxylesterase